MNELNEFSGHCSFAFAVLTIGSSLPTPFNLSPFISTFCTALQTHLSESTLGSFPQIQFALIPGSLCLPLLSLTCAWTGDSPDLSSGVETYFKPHALPSYHIL